MMNKVLYYSDYKILFIEKCMGCRWFEECERHPILENEEKLKDCNMYLFYQPMHDYFILDKKDALNHYDPKEDPSVLPGKDPFSVDSITGHDPFWD